MTRAGLMFAASLAVGAVVGRLLPSLLIGATVLVGGVAAAVVQRRRPE
jgi:hypothetical protein